MSRAKDAKLGTELPLDADMERKCVAASVYVYMEASRANFDEAEALTLRALALKETGEHLLARANELIRRFATMDKSTSKAEPNW
jgi:hypothetical protein